MLNAFGTFMLVAWLAVGLALFAIYPARKAALITVLGGMLVLPVNGVKFGPGIPAYTKIEAIGLAMLLGTIIFNSEALLAFRPHWIDLPMVVWCMCPFASSISNDLGAYDGLSAVATNVLRWGLPYFIGRIYITDWQAARELAAAIILAAVIYIPLCLFENRMSAKLHVMFYGAETSSGESFYDEFGILGWRPRVFMQSALQLTLFMGIATMLAVWLWMTNSLPRLWGISTGWLLTPLIVTTILCKALGANLLWIVGLGGLLAARNLGTRLVLAGLLLFAPVYVLLRGTQLWDAQGLLNIVSQYVSERRFDSFQTRIVNEDFLAAKALERPMVGWGGWSRARVYNEEGKDISLTDGLWIITFGNNGCVGLVSLMFAMLTPSALLLYRARWHIWRDPRASATLSIAVLMTLYMIDNLFNAMLNPIWVIACGGLATLVAKKPGAQVPSGASLSRQPVSVAA